ncbi:MAG: 4-hydroxy-3-methylbut-2-enyl diphosphate reductase [Candidatus Moraniibacteriota bacterium]|nr:MAG: 4-hydroxy-3-methylbut-2-enyl diphosphate reductase [Candidatus Moranbacteria bacterium]
MIAKVILASPHGFCAGVARAVKTVEDTLDIFGAPVYIKHEIVHNKTVVKTLKDRGAITIDSAKAIPENSVVVFSAHGSPPEDFEIARKKNCTIIDATCPLVNKVHLEMHRFMKDGYSVVYIGHKGHPEGIGVIGEAKHTYKKSVPFIETKADIEALHFDSKEKLAYLTQTTLSIPETAEIIQALTEKYPHIVAPPGKDICYATTNRQKAVSEIAELADIVLIIGSKNSSNSTRLAETACAKGKPSYLIDSADDIDPTWFDGAQTVGISAGASAPESRVQEVAKYFKNLGATIEEHATTVESTRFMEPLELKEMKEKSSRKRAS